MKPYALSCGLFLGAVLELLAGCSGPGGSCRSHRDCRSGLYCAGPNERRGCGVPPREQCADSSTCSGETCHAIGDACSPDGIGSECRPPCSTTSCAPGFRCSLEKACVPVPCDEGTSCPGHQRCDPAVAHAAGPVHTRTSGCVDIACAADADCPAGKACVNATCQDGAGTCREDIPVP